MQRPFEACIFRWYAKFRHLQAEPQRRGAAFRFAHRELPIPTTKEINRYAGNSRADRPLHCRAENRVDEQQVARAFDSVYRDFGRYANVPGFRPGKAPRALVERFVNQERVRERTLEKIDHATLPESDRRGEPDALPRARNRTPPTSKTRSLTTYKAIVPLEPQVTLGEYTGLTVEKPIFNVTDEMVTTAHRRACAKCAPAWTVSRIAAFRQAIC